MRKLFVPLLVLAVLASTGCKFKNDKLATFDNGSITRGELYQWLDDRNIARDKALDKKNKQRVRIRQIALDRLQVREAKNAGYESKPEYNERISFIEGNFMAAFYRQKLRESGEFNEDAARVSIIRLKVETNKTDKGSITKLPERDYQKNLQEKKNLAQSIISQIKSGTSFEELARKYSDDYSRKDGGDIGYIVAGTREPEFITAVFALKKGEVSQEPVLISNSFYIMKINDRQILTSSNIKKIIDDDAKADRLARRLKINSVKDIENKLVAQADVVNNIEKASLNAKNSVLFKIGDSAFTAEELDKILAIIKNNRQSSGFAAKPFDDKQKRQIVDKIFKDRLLEREARKQKIEQDPKYLRQWQSIKDSTLISLYRNEVVSTVPEVTEAMIRAEYDKMKEKAAGRKLEAYGMMREGLKERIIRDKRMESGKNWERDLLEKNHFVINDRKLEGDDEPEKK